jgi:hypothetical protein
MNYTTTDGTATATNDYITRSGTATITAGTTSTTVVITGVQDTLDENNETMNLVISSPTNATIGDASGLGTINDNDTAPTVSINSPAAVTEGISVVYTISLSAASGLPVTGSYTTTNGTAIAGSDYTSNA